MYNLSSVSCCNKWKQYRDGSNTCITMDNYFVIYAVIIFFVHYCVCDYDCLCNYNVEKVVCESADASGKLIGYLYEFDCKPLISAADPNWATIAFEHKVRWLSLSWFRYNLCKHEFVNYYVFKKKKLVKTNTDLENEASYLLLDFGIKVCVELFCVICKS